MNTSSAVVLDLEAATDQLVDEVCARLTALRGLLGIPIIDTAPPVEVIRSRATEVVCGLTSSQPRATAVAIARALWPLQTVTQVPSEWWDTPLGTVIARAHRQPVAEGLAATINGPGRRRRTSDKRGEVNERRVCSN